MLFAVRLLASLAVAPTAVVSLWVSARAVGRLAAGSAEAAPFIAGAALVLLTRIFVDFRRSCLGRAARSLYVLGHESTHALSAWALGGKVYSFKAGDGGGRVELSDSNAFIALAPYCLPIYTILVVAGYRAWLFLSPGARGQEVFLALMGLTLCFHLVFTFECLWTARQPDLAAAGGAVFSLTVIALCNGLLTLCLIKVLFPGHVSLSGGLAETARLTAAFWGWAADAAARLRKA